MYEALTTFGGGPPNNRHFGLYKRWGQSKWGMIITGNIQVDPHHLTLGRDMVVPDTITPESVAPFVQLAQCCRNDNSSGPATLAIVQLSHTGRQSPRIVGGRSFFKAPSAPSTVPLQSRHENDGVLSKLFHKFLFIPPRELGDDEVETVIQSFVRGAEVMRDAGFDGVQLHASHGCKWSVA
ncbi:hypothetical protein FRC03_007182 [Tulasnella sp. 419]|nr:hypothetical protein FRC03_007182 [Tulasnella sp. 419]